MKNSSDPETGATGPATFGAPDDTPGANTARKAAAYPNVPSPNGSKAGQNYARFIPREELRDFTAWQPGALGDGDRRAQDRRTESRGMPDRRVPPPATAPAPSPSISPAQWQARVTAARQAGYKDGYRDGLVALDGFKQSFSQQTTAQIGTLLQAFDQQLQGLDDDFAQALARTAVKLAQQVLRSELQTRPECVVEVARQAVTSLMHSARQIAVHVHPLDLPLVAEGAQDVLGARGARLQADAGITRGGVQLRSDLCTVDARVETRWAEASATLGVSMPLNDTTPVDTPNAPDRPTATRPMATTEPAPGSRQAAGQVAGPPVGQVEEEPASTIESP